MQTITTLLPFLAVGLLHWTAPYCASPSRGLMTGETFVAKRAETSAINHGAIIVLGKTQTNLYSLVCVTFVLAEECK